jgi:hypothetical protein
MFEHLVTIDFETLAELNGSLATSFVRCVLRSISGSFLRS